MKNLRTILACFLSIIVLSCVFIMPAFAHPGATDEYGGHYDRSTGEYHYHHGYPAHSHDDGVCPYDFVDKTDHSYHESNPERESNLNLGELVDFWDNVLGTLIVYIFFLLLGFFFLLSVARNFKKTLTSEKYKDKKIKYMHMDWSQFAKEYFSDEGVFIPFMIGVNCIVSVALRTIMGDTSINLQRLFIRTTCAVILGSLLLFVLRKLLASLAEYFTFLIHIALSAGTLTFCLTPHSETFAIILMFAVISSFYTTVWYAYRLDKISSIRLFSSYHMVLASFLAAIRTLIDWAIIIFILNFTA